MNALADEMAAIRLKLLEFEMRQIELTRMGGGQGLSPELPPLAGFGTALTVAGAVLSQSTNIAAFLSGVAVVANVFGECIAVPNSGVSPPTEMFPPDIVPHPDQQEVGAVLRTARDYTNPKGGFIERRYPFSEPTVSRTEAGFPPAFLTSDIKGRVYADNRNSNERFSGRLFRFIPQPPNGLATGLPLTMAREFVGTINYYSLSLQLGRPAFPVAMVAGPPFWGFGEGVYPVESQDLFVADLDVLDGKKRILRVPVSLTDLRPNAFSEASGNRPHIVGQPFVESEDFQFSGPSDMELGPDVVAEAPAARSANSVIMLSDEDSIFAMFADTLTGEPQLRRLIQIPGRRWSGLAFDRAGKFYFADYASGEVWVMLWQRLHTLIWSERRINDEDTLRENAFLALSGLPWPGDIEVEQGSSAHPGRSLFISTVWGVDKRPLPIVGRLAHPVKEMKIKRFAKEDDVHIFGDGLSFFVEPAYEDLMMRTAWLRVRETDVQTGRDRWVERQVLLAQYGATVLEDWAP